MKSRVGPLLIAGVLFLLVAAMIALLAYPKILTGTFCDITFESIEIHPDTQVDLRYRTVASSGTDLLQETATNGHMTTRTGWIHHGFLGRPGAHEEDRRVWLASMDEKRRGATDTPDLRRRLLVEQGKTYRMRRGDRLVYLRIVEANGSVFECYFQINPLR